jgi:hypothetical protein
MDAATVEALGALAMRIPAASFLAPGSVPSAVEQSQTLSLDLTPWLCPGDDLKRLRFTKALAVPMGAALTEGALLLAGMRPGKAIPGRFPTDSLSLSGPAACRRPAADRDADRKAAGHAQPDHDV